MPIQTKARLRGIAVELVFAAAGLVFCWICSQRQPWLRNQLYGWRWLWQHDLLTAGLMRPQLKHQALSRLKTHTT
jgi:hypothetical protein